MTTATALCTPKGRISESPLGFRPQPPSPLSIKSADLIAFALASPHLPPERAHAHTQGAQSGLPVGFSRPERGRPLESPWTQKSWPLPPFPPSEAGPKASARFQLRWERGERLILDRAGGGLLGRRDGKRARTGEARPPLGPSDFIRLMLPRLLRTPRARHRTQPRRTRHRRRVAGRPARAVGGGPATTPPEPRAPPDRASRPPSPSP